MLKSNSNKSRTFRDATGTTLWLKINKNHELSIKLNLGEGNKINLR